MTKEKLITYLNDWNIAVLSTISKNSTPHGAVVYFVIDQHLNFYFLSVSDTKKAQNLVENNHAALTTFDMQSMITVQSNGTVEQIDEPQQSSVMINEIAKANARKNNHAWPPPIAKLDYTGDIVVYKYVPTWLRVGDFSQDRTHNQHTSIFTQLIPTI